MAGQFTQNKICPILFGLDKKDLRGPLFQFQAIDFKKDEIKSLVESINSELNDDALQEGTLDRVFEKWWPELENGIQATLKNWKPQRPPEKSAEERHLEILTAIRQVSEMRQAELQKPLSEDIFVNLYANVDAAVAAPGDAAGLLEALSMLTRNIEFVHQRIYLRPQHLERASRVLDRIASEQKKLPVF